MRGRGKTEQRRTVRNGRHGQPCPQAQPGGTARDHAGGGTRTAPGQRGSWDTCMVTCTQDRHGRMMQ